MASLIGRAYRKPLLIAAVAGLLANVADRFPIPFLTGVSFRYGGAFTFSAGILFGPWYGLLAGLICGARVGSLTMFYFPIIALESLLVAWAVRRHSLHPITADFIFR